MESGLRNPNQIAVDHPQPASVGGGWLQYGQLDGDIEASKQSSIIEPNKTSIVLLQDVPLSLRDKMVLVSK